ncbi:3833_t:CDS:2 [Ambispora gerdemannii]|uniref:UDP-N-acetylglucosamine transferase subunit ALG14 n=1 Tax=Ambispora gerdemannii TaxID=144530 RepID=A0A9N9CK18_9GLOM|nr:3833_t:CDS:2 [Ambispora gerdemannii]
MADNDELSERKAHEFEKWKGGYQIRKIPRARKVGQSWLTTPISVIRALVPSLTLMLFELPDLIICNGPGSCIPICVISYIPRILGIKHVRIIYIESFARVNSLSLSGRLLLNFVDRFLVQWPYLAQKYPEKAEYFGVLV